MARAWEVGFIGLLLYLLFLQGVAIFFFTRGFLLSRTELPVFSHPSDAPNVTRVDADADANGNRNRGWTEPSVRRIVILIFDALRFDFAAPSGFVTADPKPWMDTMQVMHRLISEEKPSAFISKFVADPPTTSLQRLKGLTTGSLPTFIDIGNSFGAPAILEDNILHQFRKNGKRVLMMGDDTWIQLFPTHFVEAYPYPSFNVKDLDTVDDGVVKHLFPALLRDDWDVLIGHFLGVDHAGHIFGVESDQMVGKLKQYNRILEDVILTLRNQSQPGGLHQDTLLLVMGDHGQTLNGDHGGGTSEEVETALFAMTTRPPPRGLPQYLHSSPCMQPPEGYQNVCISTIPQLDLAVTLAALTGVPFPFASLGRVNPELFALAGGTWPSELVKDDSNNDSEWLLFKWMEQYESVLHLNSWQVNRYMNLYSDLSFSGFAKADYEGIQKLFLEAHKFRDGCFIGGEDGTNCSKLTIDNLADQINAHSLYLIAAADLARSKWTQFDGIMMAFGLILLFMSFIIQTIALCKTSSFCSVNAEGYPEDHGLVLPWDFISKGSLFAPLSCFFGAAFVFFFYMNYIASNVGVGILGTLALGSTFSYIRLCSLPKQRDMKESNLMADLRWFCSLADLRAILCTLFVVLYALSLLSNSFILKEGQLVSFLLASSGLVSLRSAFQARAKIIQAFCFFGFNYAMAYLCETGMLKDQLTNEKTIPDKSVEMNSIEAWQFVGSTLFSSLKVFFPLLLLGLWFKVQFPRTSSHTRIRGSFVLLFAYVALFLHWSLEDFATLQFNGSGIFKTLARLHLPRLIYSAATLQTIALLFKHRNAKFQIREVVKEAAVSLLAVWSAPILMLLGRQGPLIAVLAGLEAYCLLELQVGVSITSRKEADKHGDIGSHVAGSIQWTLFTIQLFFATGHRCTFDGLRYAAAFIGFDRFNIYLQGPLLAIDTFGPSHILPLIGLPFLISNRVSSTTSEEGSNRLYRWKTCEAFLIHGLVKTFLTIFITICVTIHRRHLMVWGLFAPKYVFDAIGLLVTDAVLVFAAAYFFRPFSLQRSSQEILD